MWLDASKHTAEHPELIHRLGDAFHAFNFWNEFVFKVEINPDEQYLLGEMIWGAKVIANPEVPRGFVWLNNTRQPRELY